MDIVPRNNFPLSRYGLRGFNEPFERFFNNMFEDFFSPVVQQQENLLSAPRLNVTENDKAYDIEAELPGVRKEDVRISVNNRIVSIDAEAKTNTERKEGENIVYAERSTRKFSRSFTLPMEVDESRAEAKLENGVLQLTLPKKEETRARQISVQ